MMSLRIRAPSPERSRAKQAELFYYYNSDSPEEHDAFMEEGGGRSASPAKEEGCTKSTLKERCVSEDSMDSTTLSIGYDTVLEATTESTLSARRMRGWGYAGLSVSMAEQLMDIAARDSSLDMTCAIGESVSLPEDDYFARVPWGVLVVMMARRVDRLDQCALKTQIKRRDSLRTFLLHEWAALGGNEVMFRVLLRAFLLRGKDFSVRPRGFPASYGSPLHLAVMGGSATIVKQLMDYYHVESLRQHLRTKNARGDTPIHMAIKTQNPRALHELLVFGSTMHKVNDLLLDTADENGFRPVDTAWVYANDAMGLVILTVILQIVCLSSEDCLRLLDLEHTSARRAARESAHARRHSPVLARMIRNRVFPLELMYRVVASEYYGTARHLQSILLHLYRQAFRVAEVEDWPDAAAQCAAERSLTPAEASRQLRVAVDHGHLEEMIELLLMCGTSPALACPKTQLTPLHILAEAAWANRVTRGKHESGVLSLEVACAVWHLGMFGADGNAREIVNGWAPVHLAAMKGNTPMLLYLMYYCNIDVNAMANTGELPLWTVIETCVLPSCRRHSLVQNDSEWRKVILMMRQRGAYISHEERRRGRPIRFHHDVAVWEDIGYCEYRTIRRRWNEYVCRLGLFSCRF